MKIKESKTIMVAGLAIGCFLFSKGGVPEAREFNVGLERPTPLLGIPKDTTPMGSIDTSNLELVEPVEVVIVVSSKEIKPKRVKVKRANRVKAKTEYQDFEATAYCGCKKCNGKWTGMPTASGTKMKAGRTIAVDPKLIPLGSKVYIKGMGEFIAEDTGSAIKGKIIDIYFDTHKEAWNFGRQQIKLKLM